MRIIVDETSSGRRTCSGHRSPCISAAWAHGASPTTTRSSPDGLRGEAHHPGSLPGRRQEGRDRGRSHGDGRRRHPDWLLGQDRRQDAVLAATVLSTFCVSSDLCHLGKSPASCGVDVGAVQYYEALTWQWW